VEQTFVVARNPDADSSLPYLIRLPIGDGLVLKAREPWPRTDSRKLAEEWTYRYLGAALASVLDQPDDPTAARAPWEAANRAAGADPVDDSVGTGDRHVGDGDGEGHGQDQGQELGG
jgi:hypothetical protein